LDRGIAGETVDRAVEVNIEGDQPRQGRLAVDRAPGVQRMFELRASGGVGLDALCGKLCRQRIDRAAYLIELADALWIELGHLKTGATALGDQALPMEQVQRVRDRLARYAEPFRKLVLADALAWQQRAVGDRLEYPGIDLVDQVREG